MDKLSIRLCLDLLCVIFTLFSLVNYLFKLEMGFKLMMHYSWIIWVGLIIGGLIKDKYEKYNH